PAYEAALAPWRDRIDYRVRERNGGPGAARNTGAAEVQDGFLVFTDDDCVPPPFWLDRLAALLAANPDLAVVGGYARPLPKARRGFVERFRLAWGRHPGPTLWAGRVHCLATLNLAVRADLFHRVGAFDERFVMAGEDLNLTYRLVQARAPFAIDEHWFVHHDLAETVRGIVRRSCRYAYGAGAHERLTGDLGTGAPSFRAAIKRAAAVLRKPDPPPAATQGEAAPAPRGLERVLFALLEAWIAFAWTRAQARGFRDAPTGIAPPQSDAVMPVAQARAEPLPSSHSAEPRVTIVLIQREYFSLTLPTLDVLFRNTAVPFRLVVVDGGSPPSLRDALRADAAARGYEVVRAEHFLPPQAARRLGLEHATTEFVVFLENDTFVDPGWLDAMLRCADETGAAVVGPLYCQARRIGRHVVEGNLRPLGDGERSGERRIVHMAGGEAHFDTLRGRRVFVERHYFVEQPLDEVQALLRREPTEMVEFHCVLARTAVLREADVLDARMPNGATHIDFCLALRERGAAVWLEPAAVAVNIPPQRFSWSDLRLYLSQWNEAANRASLDRFREKWRLAEDDPFLRDHRAFLTEHRIIMLMPLTERLRRLVGRRLAFAIEGIADRVLRRLAVPRA
ncbi:MAG: glycosyltransferase, partial [Rhodospirillaceae bacterium]|nr:glycosyltransferase [Rhodospirillaceae bacterium]